MMKHNVRTVLFVNLCLNDCWCYQNEKSHKTCTPKRLLRCNEKDKHQQNNTKCRIFIPYPIFLKHVAKSDEIHVILKKTDDIDKMPITNNTFKLKGFSVVRCVLLTFNQNFCAYLYWAVFSGLEEYQCSMNWVNDRRFGKLKGKFLFFLSSYFQTFQKPFMS